MHFSRAALASLAITGNCVAELLDAAVTTSTVAHPAYVLNTLGLTIDRFSNATAAKKSDAYKNADSENPSFLLCNNHNSRVAVVGEINFAHGRGIRARILDPEHMSHTSLMIELGNCVLVGNIKSDAGDRDYSGALYAFLGCDENGNDCESQPGVITKIEFSTNIQGKKGVWGMNLSLVDGYNGGVTISAGEGKNKTSFSCHISPKKLRKSCPKTHLIDGKQPTCKSDCKFSGDDKHCCQGAFAAYGICEASSKHLSKLCGKEAHIWPHDDKKYVEVKMNHALEAVFGPKKYTVRGGKAQENQENKAQGSPNFKGVSGMSFW